MVMPDYFIGEHIVVHLNFGPAPFAGNIIFMEKLMTILDQFLWWIHRFIASEWVVLTQRPPAKNNRFDNYTLL